MSEFKLLDRGAKDTMLLIPGWAFDHKIFSPLEIRFNYLLPVEYSICRFEGGLLTAMKKNNLKKVSILGWSMGSFAALDLASKYPDKVGDLIFVSVKKKYQKEKIEGIKKALEKNRRAFLYKFYSDCFSKDDKEARGWFRRNLLKSYLERMSLAPLIKGLDYLLTKEMDPRRFAAITSAMKFVHGGEDRIAPIADPQGLMPDLPQAEFIALERTGHIPFLNAHFNRIFDDRYHSRQ